MYKLKPAGKRGCSVFWHFFTCLLTSDPQPQLHLPQRGGASDLRPERGADHGAPPPAAAPAAGRAPVPGLLRVGAGHGGGEFCGGGEDGRARPGDPAASRHGLLPELPGSLPGTAPPRPGPFSVWALNDAALCRCPTGPSSSRPTREPPSRLCTGHWTWTRPPARKAPPPSTSWLCPASRSDCLCSGRVPAVHWVGTSLVCSGSVAPTPDAFL